MILKKKNRNINWDEFFKMLKSFEKTVGMEIEKSGDSFKFSNPKNNKSCEITKEKIQKMVANNKLSNAKICQLIFNNARKRIK